MGDNARSFIPVDVVTTPFARYIVISFKDPEGEQYRGGFFDFSGDFAFEAGNAVGLEESVTNFFKMNPNIYIHESRDNIRHITLPSGKVREVLGEESILRAAKGYYAWEKRLEESMKTKFGSKLHLYDPPVFEDCLNYIRGEFTIKAWYQLVKRTSVNYLDFNHIVPPHYLFFDNNEKGFAIVDVGTEDDCGYGNGTVFFYGIKDRSANKGILFGRETLLVDLVLKTELFRLPMAYRNAGTLKELSEKGTLMNFLGAAAYLDVKIQSQPGQSFSMLDLP